MNQDTCMIWPCLLSLSSQFQNRNKNNSHWVLSIPLTIIHICIWGPVEWSRWDRYYNWLPVTITRTMTLWSVVFWERHLEQISQNVFVAQSSISSIIHYLYKWSNQVNLPADDHSKQNLNHSVMAYKQLIGIVMRPSKSLRYLNSVLTNRDSCFLFYRFKTELSDFY